MLSIILAVVMCAVTACTNKEPTLENHINETKLIENQHSISYELSPELYTYNEQININYPQISIFGKPNEQEKLNEMIKERAYSYLDNYSPEEKETFSLDMDYSVSLENEGLLSIQFSGYSYVEGAAHPVDIFDTINIDMKKFEPLQLTDIVTIDAEFLKELKESELQSDIIEQKNILTERSDEEWLTSLQHADTSEADIRWYLTENMLGISVQISHAIGDHAEFEIKYDKLKPKLNTFSSRNNRAY